MRVLLVEDDHDIAAPLIRGLEREGFAVDRHAGGESALAAISAGGPAPDVILLDLGLPDIDGFEVCRRIRAGSEIPIIVVTARGSEVDRVVGLELGADDYVVKPFGLRELVARIRAVARRVTVRPHDPAVHVGSLSIDRRTRRVTVESHEVALTPKEFDLLAVLAEDPGAVCSRQHIVDVVWDPHWYGPTKTVDVHVANLRRKLGQEQWIETVRGVGYRLCDPGVLA